MAAPRATQFIALRNLARASQPARHLHMTGLKTYSPVLVKEVSVINFPADVASLRAECKRRKIDTSGSTSDLLSRLNADELSHSRAFSTRRPTPSPEPANSNTRHFNTSRALKAVHDTSTIDFAFLPDLITPTADELAAGQQFRVPILPTYDATSSSRPTPGHVEEETVVMRPEISTMSADAIYLPMSDLSDGHAMNIDFHAMADRVALNLRRMKVPVEEQAGVIKQIWSDMVDDLVRGAGSKGAGVAA